MLELVIRFRSQGMQWPLRAGDVVEVREFGHVQVVATITAEMIIELVLQKMRDMELLDAMKNGTPLRRPLSRALAVPLKEQRRQQRRKRP